MQQHIGAHNGHILFSQDALGFLPVCQHHPDLFGILLMGSGGDPVAGAEYRGAAFVGHAYGGKVGGEGALDRKGQAGLLEDLPLGGGDDILPGLHQPRGEFIDVAANRVAVLPDQHHLVFISCIDDDPIGFILMGHGF